MKFKMLEKLMMCFVAATVIATTVVVVTVIQIMPHKQDFSDLTIQIDPPGEESEHALVIIDIVAKRVDKSLGREDMAVCYADCIYQWHQGKLLETVIAWTDYVIEKEEGKTYLMERRNEMLVPALKTPKTKSSHDITR